MIHRIRLLRNIGQFGSVSTGAQIKLGKLALVYAENGRGKTTIGAILRSLATGDPMPISERQRLAETNPAHVVLDCDGGPPDAMFEEGTWNRTLPGIELFDDVFVDLNVYSGLEVEPEHRKNLHELILGARGVDLSRRVQESVDQIEEHNRMLREKASAISHEILEGMTVDEFCALPQSTGIDVDAEIEATERVLAAANDQATVRLAPLFEVLSLPPMDVEVVEAVLERDLPELEAGAEAQVRAHVAGLGAEGEEWLAEGMRLVAEGGAGPCPFCAQDLSGSSLIGHYRAYFSTAYTELRTSVERMLSTVRDAHGGEAQAVFERAVGTVGERRRFWSRLCDVPEVGIDTAAGAAAWSEAREAVSAALDAKRAAPLERQAIDDRIRELIAIYEAYRDEVASLGEALAATNDLIAEIKEKSVGVDPQIVTRQLRRLRATRNRYATSTVALCDDYLAEKEAKVMTEAKRTRARHLLDEYRERAFPALQAATNRYLERFGAGFRLQSVAFTNTRMGSSCTYDVVINQTPVHIGREAAPGQPSFRNTLSSGDRNTLALAFFFASLDQIRDLGSKVVVIDDPISSLDDHRSQTTVDEIRCLASQVAQVIVLSHDKRFLCRLWQGADRETTSAMEIARDTDGSTLRDWEVSEDAITDHDRRDARLRAFVSEGVGDVREIAGSLRDHLEGFVRVACPVHFPPRAQLGPFINLCRERLGGPEEILSADETRELGELKDFASRFRHDTKPAWESETINEGELRQFVERTLAFTGLKRHV